MSILPDWRHLQRPSPRAGARLLSLSRLLRFPRSTYHHAFTTIDIFLDPPDQSSPRKKDAQDDMKRHRFVQDGAAATDILGDDAIARGVEYVEIDILDLRHGTNHHLRSEAQTSELQ